MGIVNIRLYLSKSNDQCSLSLYLVRCRDIPEFISIAIKTAVSVAEHISIISGVQLFGLTKHRLCQSL